MDSGTEDGGLGEIAWGEGQQQTGEGTLRHSSRLSLLNRAVDTPSLG